VTQLNRHADLLRVYFSGAGSDGGAQASPAACLGAYRSSTQMGGLGFHLGGIPRGVRVEYAAPENGPGDGLLSINANYARWAPPGGSAGPSVLLSDASTVLLAGLSEPGKYILVSRDTAATPDGGAAITLVEPLGGLWDEVAHAERLAGHTDYRCLFFRVGPGGSVRSLRVFLGLLGTAATVDASGYAASGAVTVTAQEAISDWPASGMFKNTDTGEVLYYSSRAGGILTVPAAGRDVWGDGAAAGSLDDAIVPVPPLRLALEAPSAQPDGYVQTIADEDTGPTGRTWKHGTSANDVDALEVPALSAGQIYGLWLARRTVADASAVAVADTAVEWEFMAVE